MPFQVIFKLAFYLFNMCIIFLEKVNYVVVGEEPGPAKLEKAKNYGIPTISEDEFLDMIRVKSGLQPLYTKKEVENADSKKKVEVKSKNQESTKQTDKLPPTEEKATNKKSISSSLNDKCSTVHTNLTENQERKPILKEKQINEASISWTEKYKPKDLKGIIGQQGEKSNMNKLLDWLKNWYKYHSGKDRPKIARPSPWTKNDDGSYYKCVLLSGPPGVGNLIDCF